MHGDGWRVVDSTGQTKTTALSGLIAANITNTPAGGIAATNVQTALNELDTEKAADAAVVHLAGTETITGAKTFSVPLASSVATGTAPFTVASTTVVANLKSATSGTADTVVTNANLTGHVTSVGNAAVLGSFTLAQLNTAVSDADVVSIAGTETITGSKTFTGDMTLTRSSPTLTLTNTDSSLSATISANTGNGALLLETTTLPLYIVNNSSYRLCVMATGNVIIGANSGNANAILDIQSTTKAFMPPRMTTAQRDAVASPTAGMVVYNSTTNKLNVYTTAWEAVTSA